MYKRLAKSIWQYRGFIAGSIQREFQLRYTNSILGATWILIHPIALISVYTLIFSQVMRSRLPGSEGQFSYSIFLCAGVLTWGLFAEITGRSQSMFLDNATMIKKLRFPRVCIPSIVIGNALVNFAIIFSIFIVFLLLSSSMPGFAVIWFLPLLILLVAFSSSLGLILGILNVFFRDVGQAFSVLVTFWFWLTPIVYSPSILPAKAKTLLQLNPMAGYMSQVQSLFLNGDAPHLGPLINIIICTFILSYISLNLLRNHSADMVDEL